MAAPPAVGSASIAQPEYWWYQARASLLHRALGGFVGTPRRVLDVGNTDGPSVGWLRTSGQQVALDLDARGLTSGGVCGSAMALPFQDASFDDVNGHLRRYTRGRAVRALESQGLQVQRATYAFAAVFPFFAAERLARQVRDRRASQQPRLGPGEVPPLPTVPPFLHRLLLRLCRVDGWLLARRDLPFGWSVLIAGSKPSR